MEPGSHKQEESGQPRGTTQPRDIRKIRRRIEDMLRKDERVLLKVARFLNIA